MRALFLAYMFLYALLGCGLYLLETIVVPRCERTPLRETALDSALLLVGFAGMVLHLNDVEVPFLRLTWKLVGPALLVGWAVQLVRHMRLRPQLLEEYEMSETKAAWLELATTAYLVPALSINLAYGYL